ncbi:hypothetical protein SO802_035189 [Lithocarpus litseifolius]|uniref:Uncharacterized protein n=1 Tax=Lithocarpus litseifolius TaxID=425828 RepID=A0AAW2B7Y1_9ROSI
MQVVIMWWLKNHPFNHVAFINYGAEFSGIIKAGVVNNLSCDKVLQIRGPTKDLGPLDGTLAYSKLLVGPNLLTTTIPHLIPFVTKPGDSLQDMDRYNILGIGPNLNPQDISNCLWPSSECLVPFNGTGEVLGFLFTYILLLIIVLVSYVKFINCVDPFHEVKSKREKKKESKDIRDSRSRSANNTSNRGGRGSADRYVGHGGSSQFSSTAEDGISSVAANLQQLDLQKQDREAPLEEDNPPVIIPNHLQLHTPDCLNLSFGSFGSGTGAAFSGSGSFATRPLTSDLEETSSAADVTSIGHSDSRNPEYYGDEHLNTTSDGNLVHRTGGGTVNYDSPSVSQPEALKQEATEVAQGNQYAFPSSAADFTYENTQQFNNAFTHPQTSSPMQSLAALSSVMIAVDKNASVASCLRDRRNWNPQFSWSIQDWELESLEIVFDSILPTIHGEDQIFWSPLKLEILSELEIDAVKCLSSLVTIDIVSAAGIYKFVAQQFVGFIRSDCKGGFCIFTLSCDTINAHKIQQCGFFLSSPTMSMPEALRAGSISTPQPTQTLPGAGVATGPALPQHLAVHPYSQPTLPLGHFANMISYPFLPQSYTYMPSAYQQGFAGNSTYHQSLAAMLPQYKNSVSVSSLPQSAAIPSGYAFGSSTSIPGGNFPLNPTAAPTGTTVGYDDVLSSQFKDSNHLISLQQNDNSAMWVHGPGSRTVSALPSTYYSFQGQNQQPSGYRQGQQPSQHFSYPNYYHSQTGGLSMEHQQQNPRDAASLGASQGQPPKQSQQIWQNSY